MESRILVTILLLAFLMISGWLIFKTPRFRKKPFNPSWRKFLIDKVNFFKILEPEDKNRFEQQVLLFLDQVQITGVDTDVSNYDKLLVAASAVIPLFGFDGWRYTRLKEVLLYPNRFDHDFKLKGKDRSILGMVGEGYMSSIMILSLPALKRAFDTDGTKQHVGIHEFVHLLDRVDGATDGVPEALLKTPHLLAWVDLMQREIESIRKHKSDINTYGGTDPAEFFGVASEYFFQRPYLFKKKHPQLYAIMEEIFNQDLTDDD